MASKGYGPSLGSILGVIAGSGSSGGLVTEILTCGLAKETCCSKACCSTKTYSSRDITVAYAIIEAVIDGSNFKLVYSSSKGSSSYYYRYRD